ncbi:Phosphoribosyl-AMP cyclohydrolase [Fragilaria crotonensis]|nr:Phosphoribosyl-AMP cyclohydrolase [Fragilaria crotonensis]
MASVPYPTFVNQPPVDVSNGRAALSCVGKCRVHPETCFGTDHVQEEYRAIVAKNVEQANAAHAVLDTTDSEEKASQKKLQKKYMKQGVAMAKKFLTLTLQLDVSIVHVELYIDSNDVIQTDGFVASCFLDAGCHAIVTDGSDLVALECAKIPRERLVAHFSSQTVPTQQLLHVIGASSAADTDDATAGMDLQVVMATAASMASRMSVEFSGAGNNDQETIDAISKVLQLDSEKQKELDYHIVVQLNPSDFNNTTNDHDMTFDSMVGAIIKAATKCSSKATVSLVDPSAFQLGMSFAACMKTDRTDGLYTTVVCTRSGEALGLVYSSKESMVASLESGRAVYYSRSRQGLWRKGDTSGHYQTLHRLDVDCDGDALRFTVTQRGDDVAAFCHLNTLTCWGEPCGLRQLEGTLKERLKSAPEGSYTKRLFDDEILLRDKLVEEAQELSEADTKEHVAEELADVLYFAMTKAVKAGVSIDDAVAELDRRTRKVTRRQGDSKAFRIAAGNAILNKKN